MKTRETKKKSKLKKQGDLLKQKTGEFLKKIRVIQSEQKLGNFRMDGKYEKDIATITSEIKEKLSQVAQLKGKDENVSLIVEEIWELSKEKIVLEARLDAQLKKYKGIIFTVGFSPEPIVLSVLVNDPECVYFIYTRESEKTLDKIIEETNLKPSQYKRELIQRVSAADSYALVKKGLKFLTREKGLDENDIALDPTGGTKIMSVGCGIAATIFNVDILYVNNQKYNPDLRRPEPGSEVLVRITNPFDIYRDDKLIEGLNHFKSLNFNNARNAFNFIKQSSNNPMFPELLACVANVLYFWDVIDYSNALKFIDKAKKTARKLSDKLSPIQDDLFKILGSWETYLREINNSIENGGLEVEKISPLLIYDVLTNANREFFNSNYNNAALKYYRVIEMINQRALYHEYNFDTQNPDYTNFPDSVKTRLSKLDQTKNEDVEEMILNQYNKIWRMIYEKQSKSDAYKGSNLLPRKIGLLAGLIFRNVIGDESVNNDVILKTYQAVEKRNQSIFAHGIASISKKDCEKLRNIAEKMVKDVNIDQELKSSAFNLKNMATLVELFIKVI